jgi:spermidine/putrescine transport system ATP-binding protein
MSAGRILQVGGPRAIYDHPAERFVADFIGETNFVDGTLESKEGRLGLLRLPGGAALRGVLRDPDVALGGDAALAVRPEKIEVLALPEAEPPLNADATQVRGRVSSAHYLGTDARYTVQADGFQLVARVQNQHQGYAGMLAVGAPVVLRWRTEYGSLLA